jgi:predicted heme/steroid binding protein
MILWLLQNRVTKIKHYSVWPKTKKFTGVWNISFVCTAMQKITLRQLSLRNGQDKPEVWIAYRGKVYDVTESRLWRSGKHYEHWAGQDLTDELKDAPHTSQVFERMPCIGELTEN